jgi:hypothetical protein
MPSPAKQLGRQDFTYETDPRPVMFACVEGRCRMDHTFAMKLRNAAVGVGLTVVVMGTALAVAFL